MLALSMFTLYQLMQLLPARPHATSHLPPVALASLLVPLINALLQLLAKLHLSNKQIQKAG
jgi:hypothetical protein